MLIERLLNNLSVSVAPFALCEVEGGCELAVDEHESVTVHFVLSGSGSVRVGRHIASFQDHSLVIVPSGRRHLITAAETKGISGASPVRSGLVHLSALGPRGVPDVISACGRLDARFGDSQALFRWLRTPIVIGFSGHSEMRRLFAEMLVESSTDEPGAKAMLAALMNRCMVIVFRRLCGNEECPFPWLNALEDERIAGALDLMLQRPEADHTVESLAAAASMSRTAFSATFRSRMGKPPMTFLREIRLRNAAALLIDTNLRVGEIAAKVGLSRSQFSTAFTTHFGVPPSVYRSGRGAG